MQALSSRQQKDQSELYAIRGFKKLDRRICTLADTAWMVAYTALWHTEYIAEEEKQKCQSFIKAFLVDASDPQEAYDELIQRILLARQYVLADEATRFVPAPSVWFDETNKKGFAGTKAWMRKVEETRKSFPLHRQYLKVFAEAIQDIAETGAEEDFHYWRSYFIERGWNKMVNLLLATVGNLMFHG